jgi:N-acetylmuramoyl-L-alanine amidase
MSRKTKSASILSLVATMGIMLFGAEGSRANAEVVNYLPVAEIATETPTTQFVSQPMIQPIPEEPVEAAVENLSDVDATSLRGLVAALPEPQSLSDELHCLAGAIYFESKGESLAGQLAVGRVVVARAESGRFPSSYCGVVYQRSQFSFVRGGRMPSINTSSKAWSRAKKLALVAHEDAWQSEAEGALFFHAKYVAPGWRNRMARLAQIDNHVFYR